MFLGFLELLRICRVSWASFVSSVFGSSGWFLDFQSFQKFQGFPSLPNVDFSSFKVKCYFFFPKKAKIGDFGFLKNLADSSSHEYTEAMGTPGRLCFLSLDLNFL